MNFDSFVFFKILSYFYVPNIESYVKMNIKDIVIVSQCIVVKIEL